MIIPHAIMHSRNSTSKNKQKIISTFDPNQSENNFYKYLYTVSVQ